MVVQSSSPTLHLVVIVVVVAAIVIAVGVGVNIVGVSVSDVVVGVVVAVGVGVGGPRSCVGGLTAELALASVLVQVPRWLHAGVGAGVGADRRPADVGAGVGAAGAPLAACWRRRWRRC